MTSTECGRQVLGHVEIWERGINRRCALNVGNDHHKNSGASNGDLR